MDKRKLRIISKMGLLLVVIGFFMPVSCDMSGFDFTKAFLINRDASINSMVKNPTLIGFMCLIMFLASCLGIVLLFMIINSKDISITYDWIITIVTVSSGIIAFIGLRDIFNRNFQTGGYFIIIGWTVALLCMLLTYFEGKENQEDYKLCPYCRNNIYLGATVCQYCHKDIPPEKGNTWQCPKCNENNPNNTYQCLKCGYQLL